MNSETGPNPRDELVTLAKRELVSRFGCDAEFLVAAPGRVNLIGEHVDYNDGFVLPMAVPRYTVMAACRREGRNPPTARFYSDGLKQQIKIDLQCRLNPGADGWGRYVEGVVAGFLERGVTLPSLDVAIVSDLPIGGGLSSSAALEVATATLLQAVTDHPITPLDLALLCQTAEHRFAGVPCGIMDQFSCVFGQCDELMLLDCRALTVERVAMTDPSVTVLITNSNVSHQLATSEYSERRSQCETALAKLNRSSWRDVTLADLQSGVGSTDSIGNRRARHVVSEIARTRRMAESISVCDWETAGQMMDASHDSLRHDFEVSCDELDLLVETARQIGRAGGVLGTRMTGAGFGGSTVSLVKTAFVDSIAESMISRYKTVTGGTADCFSCRPAAGATVIAV